MRLPWQRGAFLDNDGQIKYRIKIFMAKPIVRLGRKATDLEQDSRVADCKNLVFIKPGRLGKGTRLFYGIP